MRKFIGSTVLALLAVIAVGAFAVGCGKGSKTTSTTSTNSTTGAASGGGPAPGGAPHDVKYPADCSHPATKPKEIVVTCADAGMTLVGLDWTAFGGDVASGAGKLELNDCTPNCAAGKIEDFDVSVQFASPKYCENSKGFLYTKLTIDFKGKPPKQYPSGRYVMDGDPCGLVLNEKG